MSDRAVPLARPRLQSRPSDGRPGVDALTVGALAAFLALFLVALLGERIAPFEPIYFVPEHGSDPRPYEPGLVFPFGSDVMGRDLFSVVLAGARATLTIVLLAGFGRVVAGAVVALVGSWWRPLRLVTEPVAELVAAVPATLVALLLMKAFVKTDTSILIFIGALLLTGWAGPYRVIQAEVDRLARTGFTQGAMALGVGRWRVFWRHHLPHLAPIVAINLTQQVVAALVLVAELGVLGVLVGAVRTINVEESQTAIHIGPPMSALVPEVPEWGAMLASSRTVEILWATRWVILVPGAAFALTAIAVAAIGFALARRYARRDLFLDGRAATAVMLGIVGIFVASGFVPERFAEAREWSAAARGQVRPTSDLATELERAGLRTFPAVREVTRIVRSGPATVAIGPTTVAEVFPRPVDPPQYTIHLESLVRAGTGGGVVDAPLVFAARGIVPSEHAPAAQFYLRRNRTADLGALIEDYPDDYAGIDVRGKVVLLIRFLGVDGGPQGFVAGPLVDESIAGVLARGAAGVLFVDPDLGAYVDRTRRSSGRAPVNPYLAVERTLPPERTSGVPVIVLDPETAQRLVAPLGLDLAPLIGPDSAGKTWERSAARDLGVSARIEVPLSAQTVGVSSLVAEVPDVAPDAGRVVVLAARSFGSGEIDPARADALAALARVTSARRAPFVFVDFDASADTRAIRDAFEGRRVALVLVLDDLRGGALRFKTANGDLIPAFDLYAERAGARYQITRQTAGAGEYLEPFPGIKTVVIGNDGSDGDARSDAAALIAYLAGRLSLGAPELPR